MDGAVIVGYRSIEAAHAGCHATPVAMLNQHSCLSSGTGRSTRPARLELHEGESQLWSRDPVWIENGTWDHFIMFSRQNCDRFFLAPVNYGPVHEQCYVPLHLGVEAIRLADGGSKPGLLFWPSSGSDHPESVAHFNCV